MKTDGMKLRFVSLPAEQELPDGTVTKVLRPEASYGGAPSKLTLEDGMVYFEDPRFPGDVLAIPVTATRSIMFYRPKGDAEERALEPPKEPAIKFPKVSRSHPAPNQRHVR